VELKAFFGLVYARGLLGANMYDVKVHKMSDFWYRIQFCSAGPVQLQLKAGLFLEAGIKWILLNYLGTLLCTADILKEKNN
jgi:hypothetical protein